MSTVLYVLVSATLLGLLALSVYLGSRVLQLQMENSEAQSQLKYLAERQVDRAAQEESLRTAARAEFENLALRLIEQETRSFQTSSEKGLERLLLPLRERLKEFEKKVDETYQTEGRERHVLKAEVERLIQLNERMANETQGLTQALRGDAKFQGDWGELVLEKILESSGLREGIEYTLQPTLESEDGEKFRPDVLIQLPDNKQIIVDAKVSLTNYELHSRAETPAEREKHLRLHVESLMRHVNELSDKHYPKLKGLRTPEFVFLFTPIEPAYLLAMKHDPELAMRAWNKGIAIVTSTTLFTSLKTVASIWRLEQQNRNALEIAQEAAKLYDKFVGFQEDFEKIGRALDMSVSQYEEARRKLREGPGNIYRKIELLRELGASPNKRIRPELLDT